MRSPRKLDEEKDVTGPLKRLSKEFKLFCENERHRAGQITWYFDSSLSLKIPTAEAAHIADPNATWHKICLTRFPVRANDAHLIAHEITHAVLAEEKNTLNVYESSILYTQFKAYMCSMLEDPLVESILYNEYHFNVLDDYIRWIDIMQSACEDQLEPHDRLTQIANAFHLANQMMRWKLIKDREALKTWAEFLKDYGSTHPNIYSFAMDFFAIMQKGIDTLDQRRSAFIEISKSYKIDGHLSLENKFCT
jgi:hypothetical protein